MAGSAVASPAGAWWRAPATKNAPTSAASPTPARTFFDLISAPRRPRIALPAMLDRRVCLGGFLGEPVHDAAHAEIEGRDGAHRDASHRRHELVASRTSGREGNLEDAVLVLSSPQDGCWLALALQEQERDVVET